VGDGRRRRTRPIIDELEAKFEFLMEKLGVFGTKELVAKHVPAVPADLPEYARGVRGADRGGDGRSERRRVSCRLPVAGYRRQLATGNRQP
jgi:hypothetical protein